MWREIIQADKAIKIRMLGGSNIFSDFILQATPEERFWTMTVMIVLLALCGIVWLINKRNFRG